MKVFDYASTRIINNKKKKEKKNLKALGGYKHASKRDLGIIGDNL